MVDLQKIVDKWSVDKGSSVMLPWLGSVTCGEVAEAIARALRQNAELRAALVASPPHSGEGRSSEPEFETAPDNGTPAEVLAYILDCAKRWVPEARIIGNARAGDIERALSVAPATAFTAAIDTDNSLQAAAREAGWALMELINKIDWTKRHQVEGIITRLGAALSAENPTKPIICDVLTIQHSSGFPDHFTPIRVGDRQLTTYMSKIKGQCAYHAAEFDWLLNGADEPDILAFNYDEPEGLAEYLKAIAPATADGWRVPDKWRSKFNLWFFRDISDEQRLKLFSIHGMPVDEIGHVHGFQREALNRCLPAAPTATGGR